MQQCSACGAKVADGLRKCPICGARLDRIALAQPGAAAEAEPPRGTRIPKTIQELRDFCATHHLPLEQIRFAIGFDTAEPRMFGIYRMAEREFQVYKNKADGSRAVRYQGPDEVHAVREIYEKNEKGDRAAAGPGPVAGERDCPARHRKQRPDPQPKRPAHHQRRGGAASAARQTRQGRKAGLPLEAAAGGSGHRRGGLPALPQLAGKRPPPGYFNYQDTEYYYDARDWNYWDPLEAIWLPAVLDEAFFDDYDTYCSSYSYPEDAPYGDFEDSPWYVPQGSYDVDDDGWDWGWDDDDWDWDDGDDWDSRDTDWDSDW